jgi:hypothetical protein
LISKTKIIGARISARTWRREPRMIVVLPAQVKLGEGGRTRRSRAKPYIKQYDKK